MTVVDSRIDELRRRLERDPGSRLFAQLAEEYRKAGAHAEAIRVARAGLTQHPSYPSARLTLGRALLDSGDRAGARVELEAALRDAPDNILASRFLGQALDALGELGPALVQLQKTLKMAPGDRQLESQIVSLQTRLQSPRPAPAAPAAEEAEGGPLPPTVPFHMPADRLPQVRPSFAPPPPLPPTAALGVRATAPAPPAPPQPSRVPIESRVDPQGTAAGGVTTLPASPARMAAEPFYDSDLAPTLPTAEPPGFGLEDEAAAPTLPMRAVAADERVFEVEAPSVPEHAASGAATPLSSSTLAELYFQQGLVDRALEVYRQVIDEEPGNERARSRLAELESAHSLADVRSARRAVLERTIAGLEALLVVLQRR